MKTKIKATIGDDWRKEWPCGGFQPGDKVEATFDGEDLADVRAWRAGTAMSPIDAAQVDDPHALAGQDDLEVYLLDVEAAELEAALDRYGVREWEPRYVDELRPGSLLECVKRCRRGEGSLADYKEAFRYADESARIACKRLQEEAS